MSVVPLSPYTTAAAVRGCLGVTDNELTDAMLSEQNLGLELEVDLKQWVPTYSTVYTTGMAIGAAEADRLSASYLTLYAQWFIAAQAVNLMVLAIPQMIADGQNDIRRFQQLDLERLQSAASDRARYYKRLLEEAMGTATAAASVSLLSKSVPDYDPVGNV